MPLTIDLDEDSKNDMPVLLTHHVSSHQPLAPFSVLSETQLTIEQETHCEEGETTLPQVELVFQVLTRDCQSPFTLL